MPLTTSVIVRFVKAELRHSKMSGGYILANILSIGIKQLNNSFVKSFGLTELALFPPRIVYELQMKLARVIGKQV